MLASDKAVLWACLIVLNSIGIAQIDTLIHKTPLPASLIVKIMVEGKEVDGMEEGSKLLHSML